MDICEIEYIKLIATASADKHITLWDLNNHNIIFSINMIKGGVHSIKFFQTYQVLLIAGYDNAIPVFSVTPTYYDLNICGRLIGHLHIVTAIECIEGTPMVITADDNGILKFSLKFIGTIKTWDIRSFQCCQTISLSRKTLITKLLNMDNINKIAFIGSRVNFLEFDTYELAIDSENKQVK